MSGGRHRKGNQFGDIGVPGDPRLLDAITRRTPNIAGGSLNHSFGSTILTPSKAIRKYVTTPFDCTLISSDNDTSFTVIIDDGYVIERAAGDGDALILHYPTEIIDVGGEQHEFAIAVGEQVTIHVSTDPDGVVTGIVAEITAEDVASVNPDGDTVGGEFYYKLAVLRAASGDEPAYLEKFCAKSHIFYQPLGGSGAGLTGYISIWRVAFGSADSAAIYVRLENGSITEISSGTAGADPTGFGWGGELLKLEITQPAGYVEPSNLNW